MPVEAEQVIHQAIQDLKPVRLTTVQRTTEVLHQVHQECPKAIILLVAEPDLVILQVQNDHHRQDQIITGQALRTDHRVIVLQEVAVPDHLLHEVAILQEVHLLQGVITHRVVQAHEVLEFHEAVVHHRADHQVQVVGEGNI